MTTQKKEENRWIDVHNDKVMHEMGLVRQPVYVGRDQSVWTKSKNEKRILHNEKLRYRDDSDSHFHSIPPKRNTVYAKLIIQLVPNKKFPHSTYSKECWDTAVPTALDVYTITNKSGVSKSLVSKYWFNGKEYTL
jgi:hypothetical protein